MQKLIAYDKIWLTVYFMDYVIMFLICELLYMYACIYATR